MIERGQIWWADLGEPLGSEPGFRRPVLVMQSEPFNRSRLRTIVAVVLTSNLRLVAAPGNVLLPARMTGLGRDCVANVTQIVTLDREELTEEAGRLRGRLLTEVEKGLRLVLGL